MSTTNISTIMSRYQTACGDDIIVYQFLDSNPKQMEFEFKKHFQAQHVKLEFYDAARHYEYLHWCLNYTNTAPVIGYKKLNIVSEVFTKNVGTQYDSVVIPTPSPAPQLRYICLQCGYNTDIICHLNKKNTCGIEGISVQDKEITFETNYIKITEDKWKCVQCNKIMWSKYKKSHFEKTCKKVESPLQCEFCFVMCTNKDSKYRHRKICEQNPVNLRI
jgi:hypothetical protein